MYHLLLLPMKPEDRDFSTPLTLFAPLEMTRESMSFRPKGLTTLPMSFRPKGPPGPGAEESLHPIVNSSTDAMPANALVLPTDGKQDVTLADIRRVVVVIRKGIGIV